MAGTYILIIWMSYHALTDVEFSTKETCEEAGRAFASEMARSGGSRTFGFICAKK